MPFVLVMFSQRRLIPLMRIAMLGSASAPRENGQEFPVFQSLRADEPSPASAFAEAAARVEAALGELREAEASLERQLSDLQHYRSGRGGAAAALALCAS